MTAFSFTPIYPLPDIPKDCHSMVQNFVDDRVWLDVINNAVRSGKDSREAILIADKVERELQERRSERITDETTSSPSDVESI